MGRNSPETKLTPRAPTCRTLPHEAGLKLEPVGTRQRLDPRMTDTITAPTILLLTTLVTISAGCDSEAPVETPELYDGGQGSALDVEDAPASNLDDPADMRELVDEGACSPEFAEEQDLAANGLDPDFAKAQCTMVAYRSLDDWELVSAVIDTVFTAPSGGNLGVATYTCILERDTMYYFDCCGRYFPVRGREFGYSNPGMSAKVPVASLGMPLPLQGVLGAVAGALGVSITLKSWFPTKGAKTAAEDACPLKDVTPKADLVQIPTCDGKVASLPFHSWSLDLLLEELPEDAEEL